MPSTRVLLVDGFGNWRFYNRLKDCITIVFNDRTFEKTKERECGHDVYRLAGFGASFEIRHKKLIASFVRWPTS